MALVMADRQRCAWAGADRSPPDPLMVAYHDDEWGVPVRNDVELFERLALESFQAGLSWSTILRKREAFRAAFRGFDPAVVARFDDDDRVRLMADAGIVRSRAKIEATIAGARIYESMRASDQDLSAFAWNIVGGKPLQNNGTVQASTPLSEEMSKALKGKGFKFVGPVIVYAWMQAVGMVNDHARDCFRRTEVRA